MATKTDNLIGWVGAFSVVTAYALLTFDFVEAKSILYNVLNLIGGIFLGYRVWVDRNYSNVFLEVVFVSVALYALAKIFVTS